MAQQRNPIPFLPDIPISLEPSLQNLLQAMKTQIELVAIDPTPPALVTGLTLIAVYPGIVAHWNPTLKAASYLVYRNTAGSFATALPVIQLAGNGNVSYFDVTQNFGDVTLYYWVVPLNASGTRGPMSAMASTENSGPDETVTGIPGANNQAVFMIADFDEIGDSLAIAVDEDGSNDPTVWAYVEGDDNYWGTSDLGGYLIN